MSNKRFKFYQIISIGAYIIGWFSRAMKDGIISKDEQKELIVTLLEMAGNTDLRLED